MSADPEARREHAIPGGERATASSLPDLREQLFQRCKTYLRRSIELERKMTSSLSGRLRSPWASAPRGPDQEVLAHEHLEHANRRVAQGERLVADWCELTERMEAEGHDVATARDLLDVLQGDLEAHRSHRDHIQRMIVKGR
jgi:hypothetical protein